MLVFFSNILELIFMRQNSRVMTFNYFDIEAYQGNLVKELLKMLWKRNFKKQIGINEHRG